jgi:cell cycle checkpoint protein
MTQNTLDELLKINFEEHQVMWYESRFHTHVAHHLGSLKLLNATDEQLKNIYENNMLEFTSNYMPSPHEITKDNWRHSLGDARFCLAYRDFFINELPTQGDWQKKFFQLLLDDTEGSPLIDAACCGFFHPLIHMAYAIELNSRLVACEALTLTAVCVAPLQQITTELKPPTHGTKGALQIVKEIRQDDDVPTAEVKFDFDAALKQESVLLSHYNEWKMPDDLDKTIEELFDMSVHMFASTHKPDQIDFDFFILHLVTGMDAVRKLRPHLDDLTMKRLLCSFFYATLALYISEQQPKIDDHLINDYQVEENKFNWKYAVDRTLNTRLATEVHLVKVIRALKDAETCYGSKDGLYLKTAIKTVDNLDMENTWDICNAAEPWVGPPAAKRELNIKH